MGTAFISVLKCFCYLALNRSSVFASRPGVCPTENMETSDYPCTFDTECPGLKKCCSSSKGEGCVDPVPEGIFKYYNNGLSIYLHDNTCIFICIYITFVAAFQLFKM
uniref:WAP domain-containing protein n=1 Tax=Nothoprocta perdicaria TaxID=30464 RepID=A0A8C6YQ74_NOTPE